MIGIAGANWALLVAAFAMNMMLEKYLLGFVFGNFGVVFTYYLVCKVVHKESISTLVWVLLVMALISILAALYCFAVLRTTENSGSWEKSLEKNKVISVGRIEPRAQCFG